jgi:hypothetical protein
MGSNQIKGTRSAPTSLPSDPDTYDHAGIKALAKAHGFDMKSVTVTQHDPFTAGGTGANSGTGGRIAGAEWFAELYERLEITADAHMRRIHYKLVSQDPPMPMLDGEPYINTEKCEEVLERTSLDARYLGLVPPFVDRRNPEPTIYLDDAEADDGVITANTYEDNELKSYSISVPAIERPRLRIFAPNIPQRYHLEIWCEKSTMNDILMPLGERYGINVTTALGEFSYTRCRELVERAKASGKPVRILYISDFDPAGQVVMPVSASRKIEYAIRTDDDASDLDVQVRRIVLTQEQCEEFELPRTPSKDTDRRAAGFEERYGEGVTELDALEALHPGELEQILEQEIARYYDGDLDDRIDAVTNEIQDELDDITKAVLKKHAKELKALDIERKAHAAAIDAFGLKVRAVLGEIKTEMEDEAPDPTDADWPEPDEGDEDGDPLFASTRNYLTQIYRYKEHQGKEVRLKPKKVYVAKQLVCECGATFMSARGKVCDECRRERRNDAVKKHRGKC